MPCSITRLYLLRHAKAAAARPGERDKQRELDPTGREEAAFIGDEMRQAGWTPDALVSSSATRCRQTSDIVLAGLSDNVALDVADILYEGSLDTYLTVLASRPETSVMLVGHNPTMEELFERLAGSEETHRHFPSGYPTAGLAVLDRTGVSEWQVTAVVTP